VSLPDGRSAVSFRKTYWFNYSDLTI